MAKLAGRGIAADLDGEVAAEGLVAGQGDSGGWLDDKAAAEGAAAVEVQGGAGLHLYCASVVEGYSYRATARGRDDERALVVEQVTAQAVLGSDGARPVDSKNGSRKVVQHARSRGPVKAQIG